MDTDNAECAPLLQREAVYWSTGAVAGLTSLGFCSTASRISSVFPAVSLQGSAVRHALAGAGTRFLVFDLSRDATKDVIPMATLRCGLAGCVGGLAETLQTAISHAVASRSLSPMHPRVMTPALAMQGGTLFMSFSTCAYLSSTFSESQPPSVPLTFLFGAIGGAVGMPAAHITATGSFSGAGRVACLGFLKVGTLIGIQVQASARIIDFLAQQRLSSRKTSKGRFHSDSLLRDIIRSIPGLSILATSSTTKVT